VDKDLDLNFDWTPVALDMDLTILNQWNSGLEFGFEERGLMDMPLWD